MVEAQTINVTNAGDGTWDDVNTFNPQNIPNTVSENVTFDNNVGAVEIESGQSYTVGEVNSGNGNTLSMNGDLDVGNSTNPKDYNSGNSGSLSVTGTMIIWGNLVVNNDYTLTVTEPGILIVKGDIDLKNNGTLIILGNVTVDGNFIGGNDTNINIDGVMDIAGDFTVGNGSSATGPGSITYGGSCADGTSGVCSSGPLPVELSFFNIQATARQTVDIIWKTATEQNNDYFTIERSQDGLNYETIGSVAGAGNSSTTLAYQFSDEKPLFGKSYYRLKQTDFDGTSETFEPKAIYRSNVEDVMLQPNPVERGSQLTVYTGADGEELVELSIFNSSGLKVITKTIGTAHNVEIGSDLEPGLYIVKVNSGTNQFIKRLLIK